MTAIVFDCLVPADGADALATAFRARLDQLIADGRLSGADVAVADADDDAQLVEQWERQHPDEECAGRVVKRYELTVRDVDGSLNSLTMQLAKLLTPEKDLPPDPAIRDVHDTIEEIATYPWAVNVLP
ncbi:hypothetical protein [Corynebacterium sp. 335C]